MGQSPIWYAERPENKETVEMISTCIQHGVSPIIDVDEQNHALEGIPRCAGCAVSLFWVALARLVPDF